MHKQSRLKKIVCVNVCQTIVDEVLQGIHTPERPSSPAEIYVTEEQEFLKKNPKVRGKQRRVALCVVCHPPTTVFPVVRLLNLLFICLKKIVFIVLFSFVLSTNFDLCFDNNGFKNTIPFHYLPETTWE